MTEEVKFVAFVMYNTSDGTTVTINHDGTVNIEDIEDIEGKEDENNR